MTKQIWGKVGIVAALLVGIVAIAQMKRESGPAPAAEAKPAAATGLPRLLDLGSTTCIPCKMMAPILEELKTTYAGKLEVEFIDVWQDKAMGEKYGIDAIPTQIFFDAKGTELFRHTGFYSKDDILAKLKELGIKL